MKSILPLDPAARTRVAGTRPATTPVRPPPPPVPSYHLPHLRLIASYLRTLAPPRPT